MGVCILSTETGEWRRLKKKEKLFCVGMAIDLGQEDRNVCSRCDGPLHTIVRNVGLVWITSLARWMTPSELFTALGFPITPEVYVFNKNSVFGDPGKHSEKLSTSMSVMRLLVEK